MTTATPTLPTSTALSPSQGTTPMASITIPTTDTELANIPNYNAIRERLTVAFRAGAHVDDCHNTDDVDRHVQSALPSSLSTHQQLLATISQRLLSNFIIEVKEESEESEESVATESSSD